MSTSADYFSKLSFRQKCRWIAHFMKAKYRHNERKRSLMLASMVPAGCTIVDVGANVGLLTKEFATAHGGNVNVVAFEYNDYFLSILRPIVKNLKNVEIVEARLGEEDTTNLLKTPLNNASSKGTSLLQKGGELQAEHISQEVSVMKLDTFCESRKGINIGLLKVNVEGEEFNVVKGAVKVIKNQQPLWCIEIEERWTEIHGYQPNDLFNFMFDQGYSAFSVSENGELRYLDAYEYPGEYLFKIEAD